MSFETASAVQQPSTVGTAKKSSFKRYVIAMAAATLCGSALAEGPEVRFSGFGTLGATYTKEKNADFTSTTFQPNGVGATRSSSLAPDTKLGGQANILFNDKFSGVIQVLAAHQYDNSYYPMLEWANLKYQVTPDLSVRLGRGALPIFMISETRFVSYANPWIRVPVEVYGMYPISRNDGIDITHRSRFGSVNNTAQVYYGVSNTRRQTTKIKSRPAWGINDTVELGSLSLRGSYNQVNLEFQGQQLQSSVSLLSPALASKYSLKDVNLSIATLGATYDPGQWFVSGEFVDLQGDGLVSDTRGWYVTAGYRVGKFTPYVTHSRARADVQAETTGGALGNAVANGLKSSFSPSQSNNTLGLRWDFHKNMSLKAQYDRIETGPNSTGRFTNVKPGFRPDSKVNLYSLALDFVF